VTQRSYNVLFVCADNSICSTMAEAILKRSGLGDFHAFSAGVRPRNEMKPVVAEFLKAHGIWHQDFASTGCSRFLASYAPRMDFIISLGEQTPAGLPAVWPGDPQIVHWHITREQSEFELPVPVYKLSDDSIMLEFATAQTNCLARVRVAAESTTRPRRLPFS
jgi:protein-tyrosine-phosphatase